MQLQVLAQTCLSSGETRLVSTLCCLSSKLFDSKVVEPNPHFVPFFDQNRAKFPKLDIQDMKQVNNLKSRESSKKHHYREWERTWLRRGWQTPPLMPSLLPRSSHQRPLQCWNFSPAQLPSHHSDPVMRWQNSMHPWHPDACRDHPL